MDLSIRIKEYEQQETSRRLTPLLPVIVRIDGKCFSRFTKGLDKPYDEHLQSCMNLTTKDLMEECNALFGYTQSDEINLVLYSDNYNSQIYFNGKIHKIQSVLASVATANFNFWFRDEDFQVAYFDCRAFNVPNKEEAANAILWRAFDAKRNSIQSSARSVFSHKQCLKKSCDELQEMLFQKGINWNDYPDRFKRGAFFIKQKRIVDNDVVVQKGNVIELDMPPFEKVTNRVGVIFDSEKPIVESEAK